MARLFVAVDLPKMVIAELQRIQPGSLPGLRCVKANQMHLTLHFIGEAEVQTVVDALSDVSGTPFELTLEGVGRFPPSGQAKVLWVGVQESLALMSLQAAIGQALTKAGFKLEDRPYSPHITLARCGDHAPRDVIDQFLESHMDFGSPPISVGEFVLYSSVTSDDGPIYRREAGFSLSAT